MLRKCRNCGDEYQGQPGSTLCPACADKSKKSTYRQRICRQCGKGFPGGPRAWYCPECRLDRRRAADRTYHKEGPQRPLGSADQCKRCGKLYTVESPRQMYCPECSPIATREADRQQGREWYASHVDVDARRQQRREAVAEIPCVICGKLFRPGQGAPVTCSPQCAAEYKKRKYMEWEQAHRDERNTYHKNLRKVKKDEQ